MGLPALGQEEKHILMIENAGCNSDHFNFTYIVFKFLHLGIIKIFVESYLFIDHSKRNNFNYPLRNSLNKLMIVRNQESCPGKIN